MESAQIIFAFCTVVAEPEVEYSFVEEVNESEVMGVSPSHEFRSVADIIHQRSNFSVLIFHVSVGKIIKLVNPYFA